MTLFLSLRITSTVSLAAPTVEAVRRQVVDDLLRLHLSRRRAAAAGVGSSSRRSCSSAQLSVDTSVGRCTGRSSVTRGSRERKRPCIFNLFQYQLHTAAAAFIPAFPRPDHESTEPNHVIFPLLAFDIYPN